MPLELESPGPRPSRSDQPVGQPVDQPVDQPVMQSATQSAPKLPPRTYALRSLFWLMQIVASLAAGYWWASSHGSSAHRLELTVPPIAAATDAVPVTIDRVTQRGIERGIDAVGTLHGYDELTLKTKISGRVAKVHHDFADRVTPGELLLEIDPTDAALAVEQSQRSLNSELAKWGFPDVPEPNADLKQLPTVVSARLRSELTKSQLARLTTLQARGSVVAEEIEQARTNALVAESDYANQLLLARAGAANAQLKKAELDIAQQHLAETKIVVPISSSGQAALHYTITDRLVTQGAFLAAGSDLFRLVVDETLKLRLTIPEKHARSVRVGQLVEVTTLAQATPVMGVVTRIGPAIDPATRTFQLEAEVPNQDGALKTGGFAKARVIIASASSPAQSATSTESGATTANNPQLAQTVPVAALVTFAGVQKIFLVDEAAGVPARVKEVQVTIGQQSSQWIEIVEPTLPADARVVTSGQSKLADGSSVRVRSPEQDGPAATQPKDTQPEDTQPEGTKLEGTKPEASQPAVTASSDNLGVAQ
ncbi:MAG: efflux RND transporter periplasmic adaptor subunit [Pirellulaceae bacterium]|nr:efflux RND transporter periplasmic adaptor subunit [Pirellulaceae bacterium]